MTLQLATGRILTESKLSGFSQYTDYVVERAPERRLMFFTPHVSKCNYSWVPMEIPMPWLAYLVRVPNKAHTERLNGCIVHSVLALDGPSRDLDARLYALPLPNLNGPGPALDINQRYFKPWTISYCGTTYVLNGADGVENNIEEVIDRFYNTAFRYMHYLHKPFSKMHDWLGMSKDNNMVLDRYPERLCYYWHGDLPKAFKKWEDLSLSEVVDLPWGTFDTGLTVGTMISKVTIGN